MGDFINYNIIEPSAQKVLNQTFNIIADNIFVEMAEYLFV